MILLREGVETILIVGALVACFKRTGASQRVADIYGGALVAIAASFGAAWVLHHTSSTQSPAASGLLLLGASVVMLYVSGWMFVGSGVSAFQGYLKSKVPEALTRNTRFAVAALAFFAVFREGFETALFLQALVVASGGWSVGLVAGLMAASMVLLVLVVLADGMSRRFTLRTIFLATSGTLFLMGIKLLGDAIQHFQESLYVSQTDISNAQWLSAAGLNPTWEAVILQILVLASSMTSVLLLVYRSRRLTLVP